MPSKPVDFKERNVRRALRAADKEGLVVRGYEILPSGLIRVLTGPSDQKVEDPNANEWDDYGKPAA